MHYNLRLIFDELGKIYIIENFYEMIRDICDKQIIPSNQYFGTALEIAFSTKYSWKLFFIDSF